MTPRLRVGLRRCLHPPGASVSPMRSLSDGNWHCTCHRGFRSGGVWTRLPERLRQLRRRRIRRPQPPRQGRADRRGFRVGVHDDARRQLAPPHLAFASTRPSVYGQQSAWGFHLTNVVLHAADAVLLFLALRVMTGTVWRSAMVAALFAVHPAHVESVAWVAERKDVLSALFWMLTLLAYAWYAVRPAAADTCWCWWLSHSGSRPSRCW